MLSTVDRSFERIGRGELYLAIYPAAAQTDIAAAIAAPTITKFAEAYFKLFYADGAKRKALGSGILPYGNLTSDGLKVKVKQNLIEVDPNSGPKHTVGISDTEMSFEVGFIDATPQKLAELASCSTEELIATAAGALQAGKSLVAIGGASVLTKYVMLYRMPSATVPGEFDNWLFPRVTFTMEFDADLNKKGVLVFKVKGSILPEAYGMVNAAGIPEMAIYDISNAVATS